MVSTVYFARWILLPEGSLLENGGVAVSENRIVSVASRGRIKRRSGDRIVNLGDLLLLPGLINMHTHLEESSIRGAGRSDEEAFSAWRAKRRARLADAPAEAVLSSVRLAIRESLANGTTTVVDSSSRDISPLVLRDEPIRSWVVHEAEPPDADAERDIAGDLARRVERSRRTGNVGVGPYAFYSMSPRAHKAAIELAKSNSYLWASHMAESAEELQAFSEQSGDLYFYITRRKEWPFGNTERGAMYAAITENLIPNNAVCFHCNYVNGQELSLLAAKNVSVVLCPQYAEFMGHKPCLLDVALGRKINVCLGTEGPVSFTPLSMFDELYCLKRAHPHISARAMLSWATLGAAKALRCADQLGTIAEGKLADLIGVRFPHDPHEDLLEEMILSEPEILFVMVDGSEVISGY